MTFFLPWHYFFIGVFIMLFLQFFFVLFRFGKRSPEITDGYVKRYNMDKLLQPRHLFFLYLPIMNPLSILYTKFESISNHNFSTLLI